jgi:hypothetical protein
LPFKCNLQRYSVAAKSLSELCAEVGLYKLNSGDRLLECAWY